MKILKFNEMVNDKPKYDRDDISTKLDFIISTMKYDYLEWATYDSDYDMYFSDVVKIITGSYNDIRTSNIIKKLDEVSVNGDDGYDLSFDDMIEVINRIYDRCKLYIDTSEEFLQLMDLGLTIMIDVDGQITFDSKTEMNFETLSKAIIDLEFLSHRYDKFVLIDIDMYKIVISRS